MRSRLQTALLGSALFFVMTSVPARAQDIDYFSLQPDQLLEAEIISVSKKRETFADAAAAIYVISQKDIRRSGVTTIPDALRMVPGVQVAQADSNSWAVSIRGFNSVLTNKLLVLIDGRSVYNPLFAGTYWELQDYVLEDIDRIEVIRGPGGTLWGANAVNGVINIITKSAGETQGNLVSGLYGNQEQGTVSARHGGAFGPSDYYRVYAKYFNRDSYRSPAGGDSVDDWKGGRAGFRADWNDNLTLQGDVYRILTDQRNSTPILVAPFAFIEEETIESQGANLLGRFSQNLDDGALLSVQTYLDYTSREQILLDDKRGIFDIEAQYNFANHEHHEIITGAGYRLIHDDLSGAPSVTFSPSSRTDHLFSTFIQDKITLSPDKWYLTLGSKFEHNDYTGFEAQPNVRLQYHPDTTQMVWTAISRAVRTPSRLEHDLNQTLTVFPSGTPAVLQANGNFGSERLTAYELGYRKQFNRSLSVDIATFYNDYDDLATIGFLPASLALFPVEAINDKEAEAYGFEIASTWNVTPAFELTGSYTFFELFSHVTNNGGFDLETDENVVPHHQANIRAAWRINDNVTIASSAYYVDQLSQGNVDDYVRLDLNLGWQIEDNVRFNLIGQNLIDEAHREFSSPTSLNAAEVERSIFGKLTWQF